MKVKVDITLAAVSSAVQAINYNFWEMLSSITTVTFWPCILCIVYIFSKNEAEIKCVQVASIHYYCYYVETSRFLEAKHYDIIYICISANAINFWVTSYKDSGIYRYFM